jgi:hypothetical protein
MDAQIDYTIKHYPHYDGMVTYFIDGDDHEGNWWQKEGVHFGKVLEERAIVAGRNDLRWLGYVEGNMDLLIGDVPVSTRLTHPGGGSAYAPSTKSQVLVDKCAPNRLPNLWLVGHYHKGDFLPDYKGVAILQTGCAVDVGPWAHKQPLIYHIGGWLIDIETHVNSRPTFGATYFRYEPSEWVTNEIGVVFAEA